MVIGIVSPGYMGSGLGWALRQGGARVVSTVEGRSARTRNLASEAGLELLPSLSDVVRAARIVLIVTPPGDALEAARSVAAACTETDASPIVADLNAVAPSTMESVASALKPLRVVDGSISGPPPTVGPGSSLYLSGPDAQAVADLPWEDRIRVVVLDGPVGTASALKMCTGSVYKGLVGLVTQAMRTAGHYGVLEPVLEDLRRAGLERTSTVHSSAKKAHRFVAEMHEVAATQAGAGLTPDLFAAFAEVFADVARTSIAVGDPESIDPNLPASAVVAGLGSPVSAEPGDLQEPSVPLR
jgi:3-hydroxyisobutyrate dehydrogenase-like beta-hydroxyacid dehydrogenase